MAICLRATSSRPLTPPSPPLPSFSTAAAQGAHRAGSQDVRDVAGHRPDRRALPPQDLRLQRSHGDVCDGAARLVCHARGAAPEGAQDGARHRGRPRRVHGRHAHQHAREPGLLRAGRRLLRPVQERELAGPAARVRASEASTKKTPICGATQASPAPVRASSGGRVRRFTGGGSPPDSPFACPFTCPLPVRKDTPSLRSLETERGKEDARLRSAAEVGQHPPRACQRAPAKKRLLPRAPSSPR